MVPLLGWSRDRPDDQRRRKHCPDHRRSCLWCARTLERISSRQALLAVAVALSVGCPSLASIYVPSVRRQLSHRVLRLPCPRTRDSSDRRPRHALVVLLLGAPDIGRALCPRVPIRNRRLLQTQGTEGLVNLCRGSHRLLHRGSDPFATLHRSGLSRTCIAYLSLPCRPPQRAATESPTISKIILDGGHWPSPPLSALPAHS